MKHCYDAVLDSVNGDGFGPGKALQAAAFSELIDRPKALCLYLVKQALFEYGGAFAMSRYANVVDQKYGDALRRHASDEDRHYTYYAAFLESEFGQTISEVAKAQRIDIEVDFLQRLGSDDVGFYCDTHTAELRTQNKLDAFILALKAANAKYAPRLTKLVEKVRDDEAGHVSYTKAVICDALDTTSSSATLTKLRESFASSNVVAWRELGSLIRMIEHHPLAIARI